MVGAQQLHVDFADRLAERGGLLSDDRQPFMDGLGTVEAHGDDAQQQKHQESDAADYPLKKRHGCSLLYWRC